MEKQKVVESQEIESMKQRVKAYKNTLNSMKDSPLLREDNLISTNKKNSQIVGALKIMEEENEQINRENTQLNRLSTRLDSIYEMVEQLKVDVHSLVENMEKFPYEELFENVHQMLSIQQSYIEEDREEKLALREGLKELKDNLMPLPSATQKTSQQPTNFRQLRNMVQSSREIYDPTLPSKNNRIPPSYQPPSQFGNQPKNQNSYTNKNIINSTVRKSRKKKDRQQLIVNKRGSKTLTKSFHSGELTKKIIIKSMQPSSKNKPYLAANNVQPSPPTENKNTKDHIPSFFSFFRKRKPYEKK
ncbi:hypothetical protein [Halobacillus sp. B23F22_1]|uniref:hypothetical protein n=1 Tax=Halobacillus sp. B23F22_1 TaxID=3459514 RepID=UPI00373E7016